MIDKKTIMKLAKQAGMNFTPAQFSGVLEDEIDEFDLEKYTKLVEEHVHEKCASICENLYWGLRIQPTKQECADAIRGAIK